MLSANRTTLCFLGLLAAITALQPASTRPAARGVGTGLARQVGDGYGGEGLVLTPSDGNYKQVVVALHGLTDSAEGLEATMPALGLSDTKFIIPSAARRRINMNGGFETRGWMDIGPDRKGMDSSAKRIQAILDGEKARGLSTRRMAVAGFSQGGAIALHLAMRTNDRLAACVSLSSWLPLAADYPSALSKAAVGPDGTPVLQCHGDADGVVPQSSAVSSNKVLRDLGVNVEWKSYPGLAHTICEEELADISRFIQAGFAAADR